MDNLFFKLISTQYVLSYTIFSNHDHLIILSNALLLS